MALAIVTRKRRFWLAFGFEALLVFYEYSFSVGPVREWIRLDLLVTMPVFWLGNAVMTVIAFPKSQVATFGLAGSVIALPLWLVFGR